jgi:hypothetical protein
MSAENPSDEHHEQNSDIDRAGSRPDVHANEVDHAVNAWSATISALPGAGSILAEVVRTIVPNQRMDRMGEYLKELDIELSDVRRDLLETKTGTQEFGDLFRDTAYQAADTSSQDRRHRLAALLRNSLTHDEIAHEQERKLLSILGQLNDAELIILGYFGTDMVGEKADEYLRRHGDLVMAPMLETGMSDEESHDETMKQEYRTTLNRLGLTAPNNRGSEHITRFGRLLLHYIDGPESRWLDSPVEGHVSKETL